MIVHKYFDFRFHIKNNTFLRSPLGNSVHTKLLLFSCHKTKTLHCNWCSRKRKDPERMLSVRWGEEKRLCYGNDSMRRLIILMRRRFHWDHSVVQSVASLHFNITDVWFFFHSLWKWWVILFAMGHFQSVLSTRRHTLDSQKNAIIWSYVSKSRNFNTDFFLLSNFYVLRQARAWFRSPNIERRSQKRRGAKRKLMKMNK